MKVDRSTNSEWGVPVLAAIALCACGCSSIISSATGNLADSLTTAVLEQNDPETVRQGAPTYLLLIDGLIADSPKNVDLLLAGAGLYSSYAGTFVDDPERASRLAEKGRDYGWRALCRSDQRTCGSWSAPYDDFDRVINDMGINRVPVLLHGRLEGRCGQGTRGRHDAAGGGPR